MFCETKDGQRLYYEVFGNPLASDTVVFLNGLTQSTTTWAFMTPYFKQKYRIVLLDFVFQGQSSKDGVWRDFDTHAEDLKTVLDKVNTGPVFLVGISYGSAVAQHMAVRYPQYLKKLVLLSTFAHKTPYYELIEHAWWRALETGGYQLMLDVMIPSVFSEHFVSSPLGVFSQLKKKRQDLQLDPETIFKLMRATRERKDYRKDLEKISTPTLIIQGEVDMLFPVEVAREVQRHIPHSTLLTIPNTGHTLNVEHVEEVSQHILRFLN